MATTSVVVKCLTAKIHLVIMAPVTVKTLVTKDKFLQAKIHLKTKVPYTVRTTLGTMDPASVAVATSAAAMAKAIKV